mgnify:CR=1 FL=1
MNFKKFFLKNCKNKNFEINQDQINIINDLKSYYTENFKQNLFTKIFKKKDIKLGFYLVGNV